MVHGGSGSGLNVIPLQRMLIFLSNGRRPLASPTKSTSRVLALEALPVVGDSIQLERAILSLVVNGMDAPADMPSKDRQAMLPVAAAIPR
jgi:hypothetical protein